MLSKITVVGAGNVGATTAHRLDDGPTRVREKVSG